MKINVTVDLSEFYSQDEEMTFSSQIKSDIAYRVKQSIFADFRDKIGSEFKEAVVFENAMLHSAHPNPNSKESPAFSKTL